MIELFLLTESLIIHGIIYDLNKTHHIKCFSVLPYVSYCINQPYCSSCKYEQTIRFTNIFLCAMIKDIINPAFLRYTNLFY